LRFFPWYYPIIGVYFLLDDIFDIVYIGESTWIPGRIKSHMKVSKIQFSHFCFKPCKIEKLASIERRYIEIFLPKNNKLVSLEPNEIFCGTNAFLKERRLLNKSA